MSNEMIGMKKIVLVLLLVFDVYSMDDSDDCGISVNHVFGDRIVGGREALPKEFPWMVSIQQYDHAFQYHHFCGGTILNKHWILTAAHCLTNFRDNPEHIQVIVGTNHLSPNERGLSDGESRLNVERIVIHSHFSRNPPLNDIALIKVRGEINFKSSNGWSHRICLPEVDEELEQFVIAAGWGHTSMSGPPEKSPVLMTVKLPVYPQNRCRDKYGTANIQRTVFCAGSNGDQDTCHGDSGGPVIQFDDNKAVVVGIVSYGSEPNFCGRPLWPAVYTLVSEYVDWINSHIQH